MRDGNFKLADAMAEVLNRYSTTTNPGDWAKLLVSAFFTWACDKAVSNMLELQGHPLHYFLVTDLFKSLFSDLTFSLISISYLSLCGIKMIRKLFGQIFENAYMHFTHFIKPQE